MQVLPCAAILCFKADTHAGLYSQCTISVSSQLVSILHVTISSAHATLYHLTLDDDVEAYRQPKRARTDNGKSYSPVYAQPLL